MRHARFVQVPTILFFADHRLTFSCPGAALFQDKGNVMSRAAYADGFIKYAGCRYRVSSVSLSVCCCPLSCFLVVVAYPGFYYSRDYKRGPFLDMCFHALLNH